MRERLRMLGYIISSFVFVKLYTTIEFQLQQHNRGRGDFRRTNTRWSVLGISNRQALSDCTNTSIDYLLFCFFGLLCSYHSITPANSAHGYSCILEAIRAITRTRLSLYLYYPWYSWFDHHRIVRRLSSNSPASRMQDFRVSALLPPTTPNHTKPKPKLPYFL